MNRLWVRISFVIVIVVIFGMLFPLVFGIATREFRDNNAYPPPEIAAEIDLETWREMRPERGMNFFPGWFVLNNLAPILLGATIVSILAGVLLSRNLSAPLSNLAAAARSIGQRNLSQRVSVRGSQEIQEVAQAFNDMANDLQQAETLRQNLLADVAHELRTPITVIQGNLQAILDDIYELDKTEIARLYDQTRQLTRLVDDLRELAQAEAGQLPLESLPIDLSMLVADVASVYDPLAEAQGIELQTQCEEVPQIQGDRARLLQCLQNLLNNAVQHTPEGGQVRIVLQSDATHVEVSILDTGSGIIPEQLPHVFDRFYRADLARARETGGTGLGLAITRAIVENHGGMITAESAGKDQGSKFTIKLPHQFYPKIQDGSR